jgi:hypothetical protein
VEALARAPERAPEAPARPDLEPERESRWQPALRSEPRHRLHTALTGMPGVALAAVIVGVAAAWFASAHDLTMLYADARSHLTIARRLVDGPNHNIVQLGTVWLPLPHLALLPFVWSRALWHSGIAAVPVDVACLVVESLALFSLATTLTRSKRVAWLAVALLLTNPSILYLHTTALTEPVLFASLLVTVAMLARWAAADKPYSGGEIALYCGLPAAAMVLSRYDGWAMAGAATVYVVAVAQWRWRQWRYSMHIARCFVTLPVIAAAWWMWFNWVNWGDPLEFQRGQYSAQAQQELLAKAGLLPDKGNVVGSVETLLTTVVRAGGIVLVAAAVVGMVLWINRSRRSPAALAPWLLVVVPFGFYAFSLFTGQIVIRLDNTPLESMFNTRYGVETLPGLIVFAALGVWVVGQALQRWMGQRRGVAVLIAAVVVLGGAQVALWAPGWSATPVVAEGLHQRAAKPGEDKAAHWMEAHAGDGMILIDDSVNPVLTIIDADFDRVAAPFSGRRWTRTLRNPARAEWVYADTESPQDQVARAIRRDPSFHDDFVLRYRSGTSAVYQRRAARS